MKKSLFIILGIFLITIISITYFYYNYQKGIMKINQFNSEYEACKNQEISGSSLMTLINKVIDQNEKNAIQKDSNNRYAESEENSIRIEVKFLESKKTYDMEAISKLGSEAFIKNYHSMVFKCTEIKYHEDSKKVMYMLFEQI